ncbi:MAG: hypothetical protein H6622_17720 [Halobacteriovoraceae bacterium]|nr:hypothetical protein [Halobacteriovoraceae bacterium]
MKLVLLIFLTITNLYAGEIYIDNHSYEIQSASSVDSETLGVGVSIIFEDQNECFISQYEIFSNPLFRNQSLADFIDLSTEIGFKISCTKDSDHFYIYTEDDRMAYSQMSESALIKQKVEDFADEIEESSEKIQKEAKRFTDRLKNESKRAKDKINSWLE